MKMNLISIFVCLLPLVTMLASKKQILRSRSFRNFVADNSADRSSENVDVNLFSRQLMVYGFSAQDCLSKSSIYINSNGPLAAEIFKNLVLSGIGRIVLKTTEKTPPAFIGKLGFKRFAAEINGNVKVDEVSEDPITFADFAVVVCVGGKFTDAASLNAKARDAGAKFVYYRTVGVGGCLFSDFLSDHVAEIPSPSIAVPVLTGTVLGELKEEWHLQPLWNEKLRELSDGDVVALSWPCNTTDVTRSFDSLVGCVVSINLDASNCSLTFVPTQSNLSSIQATSLNQALGSGVVLLRQLPRRLLCSHQSLEDQLRNPTFSPLNYCNSDKANDLESKSVFAAFKALDSSYRTGVNNYGRSSRPIFKRFQREFDAALHDLIGEGCSLSDAQTARVHRIRDAVYHCVGVSCPATNTVLGAMAAQEVIKATTRQFPPMASQWWVVEAFDTLPDTLSSTTFEEKCQPASGTDKLTLETEVAEELARLKVLVVGSGAIGCDLLKMLAQFGVGSSGRPKDHSDGNTAAQPLIRKKEHSLWDEFGEVGGVVVTDMDVIEKSNLNRQYLFRFKDIGKPKSLVAAAAIRRKFPSLKIRPLVQKVGPSFREDASKQPDEFSSAFWKNCDVVLTALDNVEARRFVDSKCQRFGKPLIDSGTTGLKASTQVVYPHVTETYSSSTDVEKDEIPVCTLKSFPFLTEHCCAWAKVAFQSVASEDVQLVRRLVQFKTKPDLNEWLNTLSEEENNVLQEALIVLRASEKKNAAPLQALLGWAIQKYNRWFDVEPCRLLESYPADSVDEDGVKFWGGTRRLPRAHKFDGNDRLARICVVNLAAQRWRLLFDRHANHGDLIARFNDEMDSPSFVAPEAETISAADWVSHLDEGVRLMMLDRLSEEEFDKDDVLKGHVDLVASLSNLRARTFDLPEMERLDVLRIAGNVIPALPTTTSLVAGLVALELVKLASDRVRQRRQAGRIMGNFHNDDCYADELPVIPVGKKTWSRSSVANRFARQLMKSASNCFSALLRVAPSLFCSKRTNADHERDHLLRKFRNHFIDLSRPTFSYAEPSPVAVSAGPEGCKFTDWDNIEITAPFNQFSIGELLQQLKRKLQLKAAYQVNSVLLNDTLLYPILEEDNFEFRPEMTFNRLLAIAQESSVDAWLAPARAKDEIELVVEISDSHGNVCTLPRIIMRNDNSKVGLKLWLWG